MGRWALAYDGSAYDFSTLQWCESSMHLVDTTLQVPMQPFRFSFSVLNKLHLLYSINMLCLFTVWHSTLYYIISFVFGEL